MNPFALTAISVALTCSACASPAQASISKKVDESIAVEPDGRVDITNVSGSVRVRMWDRAEVRLRASLGEDVESVEFERKGGGVKIRVVLPKNWIRDGHADLVVDIPSRAALHVDVVNASVDVEAGAEVDLQTVNGDITAKTIGPRARLRTVNGDIDLVGTELALDVSTVSGDVVARVDRLKKLRARSVSGDLELRADAIDDASHEIDSQSGDVHLTFPEGAPVRVNTRSFRERGVLGDAREGAVTIDASTFSGRLELKRR